MSEQLLKFGFMLYYLNGEYVYQIFINNMKQFKPNILMILCQLKELWNISEKYWLNLTNRHQGSAFFTHKKNTQEGQAFIELTNCFPWSHL